MVLGRLCYAHVTTLNNKLFHSVINLLETKNWNNVYFWLTWRRRRSKRGITNRSTSPLNGKKKMIK
jgi:hypothetical protein